MSVRFSRPRIEAAGSPFGPLLDVVLLLLIFFVVTSSFSNQALVLALPSAESGRTQARQGLVVAIDAAGAISIDAQATTLAELRERLVAAKTDEQPIELRADRATAHEHVVAVLDLAQASGVSDLAIAVAGSSTRDAAPGSTEGSSLDAAGPPDSH